MLEQQVEDRATESQIVPAEAPASSLTRSPRRSFLRKAATIAAAAPAAMILGSRSSRAGGEGPRLRNLYPGWARTNFEAIQSDENTHVAYLVNALGASARPMPNFVDLRQPNEIVFAEVARNLENTGSGAYPGALPYLLQFAPSLVSAAASIGLIEARHSGFLNTLIDLPVNDNILGEQSSFEVSLTPQQVVALAGPFFVDLNGGPPLIPAGGFTTAVEVLNFALALEYLEASFYNINVPLFFPEADFPPPSRRRRR